jgi:hypothetical protein
MAAGYAHAYGLLETTPRPDDTPLHRTEALLG